MVYSENLYVIAICKGHKTWPLERNNSSHLLWIDLYYFRSDLVRFYIYIFFSIIVCSMRTWILQSRTFKI